MFLLLQVATYAISRICFGSKLIFPLLHAAKHQHFESKKKTQMSESLPGNPTVTNLYAQSRIHAFDAIKCDSGVATGGAG